MVLVDLREHGRSRGFPPPHTVAAAVNDLVELARRVVPPSAILGHSFGGKVALRWLGTAPAGLRQVWAIDSSPGAGRPAGSAWRMLETLEQTRAPFATRDEAVRALQASGTEPAVAQWMATNLEHTDSGYTWRFDLAAMRALLEDFFRTDAWDVVESPPASARIHFVKATRSSVISGATAARIQAAGPAVTLHAVEGGHWLNADNPDVLHKLLSDLLPATA
jgi:pimeloyl-ACP methyl ester carboxylesterase